MPRYLENARVLLTGRTRTPLPSLSKSSLSPLRTPSTRRISRGTVICPLLVIVACFCIVSLYIPYFIISALLWLDSCKIVWVPPAHQLLTRRRSWGRCERSVLNPGGLVGRTALLVRTAVSNQGTDRQVKQQVGFLARTIEDLYGFRLVRPDVLFRLLGCDAPEFRVTARSKVQGRVSIILIP